MRIKITRENAEFLAAGLVKKLFQVKWLFASNVSKLSAWLGLLLISLQLQQALRHFSMFISHVGTLRRFLQLLSFLYASFHRC